MGKFVSETTAARIASTQRINWAMMHLETLILRHEQHPITCEEKQNRTLSTDGETTTQAMSTPEFLSVPVTTKIAISYPTFLPERNKV
jgi:hypothetical protein